MAIQFNSELQKFYDYINTENANNRGNDDAAVQLGAGKKLGAATKTANAVRRWICLTDSAAAARKANNDVRAALLTAVAREYKGLNNIPESVKTALKMKDFECEQQQDGSVLFKSGKPLTQRRITAVINAIVQEHEEAQVERINDLKEQITVVDPGQADTRRNTAINEILCANPHLMDHHGIPTPTGTYVINIARLRFTDVLDKLDNSQKIEYLTNYKTHARNAAQFMNNLTNRVSDEIDELINHPSLVDKLNAPDRNKQPADELRIALRKKIFKSQILDMAFNRMFGGGGVANDRDQNFYLDRAKKALRTEDGQPTDQVKNTFSSLESVVDIAHTFITEAKAKFGIDMPDSVVDGIISSAVEAHFEDIDFAKAQKRANGFIDMLQSALNACDQNKEKALKVFTGIVITDVSNPKFVTLAKELINALDDGEPQFPAEPTNESMTKFCRDLADKFYDKFQEVSRKGEFGANDHHCVATSFAMILFATREDAASWLQARTKAELEQFCNYMGENRLEDETNRRAEYNDEIAQHLISAFDAAKVYID